MGYLFGFGFTVMFVIVLLRAMKYKELYISTDLELKTLQPKKNSLEHQLKIQTERANRYEQALITKIKEEKNKLVDVKTDSKEDDCFIPSNKSTKKSSSKQSSTKKSSQSSTNNTNNDLITTAVIVSSPDSSSSCSSSSSCDSGGGF